MATGTEYTQPGGQLHNANTTDIDAHVRECATKLNDSRLLAKLAMSEIHTLDAQYHRKCLVALYNHMRKYSNCSDTNPNHDCRTSSSSSRIGFIY